jgi:DNA-binding CsgD family transcriptional regulator
MSPRELQSILSPAEYSVLRELVLRGATSAAIAKTLKLSTFTVSNHLRRIYTALGVHSRTEIMAKIMVPNLPLRFVTALDVVLPPVRGTAKELSAGVVPAHTLSRKVAKKKKPARKRASAKKS